MADCRIASGAAVAAIFASSLLVVGCSESGAGNPAMKPSTPANPAAGASPEPPAQDQVPATQPEWQARIDRAIKLNASMACTMCHALEGPKKISESYSVLYGTEVELEDGTKVLRDENYLRLAIIDPNAQVPKGATPSMPSYEGRLTMDDVDLLVDLIKHLSEKKGAPE